MPIPLRIKVLNYNFRSTNGEYASGEPADFDVSSMVADDTIVTILLVSFSQYRQGVWKGG